MLKAFLTDLDSRATVKGSRDPLGIQSIWTRMGRHVIGNLTTVSNSVRDFTTLLLGLYFSERLADELGPGSELSTFLKWEQLAAYARRQINKDRLLRGIERVEKNLSEGARVTISDDRTHQILGNQKIYGLWGLYMMPARASGLVDGTSPRLTAPAIDLVENFYLPSMQDGCGRKAKRVIETLLKKSCPIDVQRSDAPMLNSIAGVLKQEFHKSERDFYRLHLLHGGPADRTQGLQQQLVTLLERTLSDEDFAWTPAMIGSLAKDARAEGESWHELSYRLERIKTTEMVIAPVSMIFSYLLGLAGRSISQVQQRFEETMGKELRTVDRGAFQELRTELGGDRAEVGDRWVAIADTLGNGEYAQLIELLIEQNKWVMSSRGGAPWIEIQAGKLNVRFRDEQGSLPRREEIATLWRFPYFLNSLRSAASTLKEN